MHGVSIIIPTRNEADNIDLLLQRIFGVEYLQSIDHEIIFVDDGSEDDTRAKIRHWSEENSVRLIERDTRGGLASAVVTGAQQARFDITLVMDADLSHPPEKIPELIEPLVNGTSDMVIGSRYVEGGATPEWPASRKIASKLATLPARLFSDVNDPMAGFFSVFTRFLRRLRSDVPGFKIGLEVLAVSGDDLRVLEVPIIFNDRFEGFSKMNKRIIFEYLKQVVQLSPVDIRTFSPTRVIGLAGIGLLVDLVIFYLAQSYNYTALSAHLAGMTGSSLVLFSTMFLMRLHSNPKGRLSAGQLLGFPLVLVYSSSVQGAVFQMFRQDESLGMSMIGFIPGALAGIICFLILAIIYIFSDFSSVSRNIRLRLTVIGGILMLVLLRLVYLGLPELMEQEAYYWNYAQHPSLSYLDHPPLAAVLIGIGTFIFGTNEFGVRIGAFLCWFVIAFFSYRLTSRTFNKTAALGSVFLVGMLPLYFGTGFIITPDAPLHAAWAAFIYFLYRAVIDGRSQAWKWAGVSLGLGMLSKYTIVLLGPGVLFFLLVDKKARGWFIKLPPYIALLIAVALFMPVLIWNYQHEWVSFLFQSEQRVSDRAFFTTHRLLGYISLILTPAGLLAMLLFFSRGNFYFKIQSKSDTALTHRFISREYLLLLLLVLAPLSVFFLFSLTREVKLNWTSPLWLAAMPFLGFTVASGFVSLRSIFRSFLQWLWRITAFALIVFYAVGLHYATLGLPGVPYLSDPFLLGWEELAEEVESVVDQVEEYTGKRPIVVGMDAYQISSGLAFYRSKISAHDPEKRAIGVNETVGWHLFGWDSLMYRYWAEPEKFYGRDILVIASSKIRAEYPYFQNRYILMNNIHPFDVTKDGEMVKRFYFRVIRGYREPRQ